MDEARRNAADTDAVKVAQAELDAAKAKLADANAKLESAKAARAAAKAKLDRLTASQKTDQKTDGTTATTIISTPSSANDANKAAVKTAVQAKLGDTGVDVAEVTVYAMAALGTAGALTMLKRRGEGCYDMMARHAK